MGAIKESPQVTQDGQRSGQVQLEITYGGKEAPFGGIDTSAPPAYIDPKCFTNCDGFIVVDNKLVAASLNPVAVPPLFGATPGVILIGFGNFYSTKFGTLNYALGYTTLAVAGPPTGVEYTFYMTAWGPSTPSVYWNDTLVYTLFNSATPATYASITMQLDQTSTGATPGTGATVNITTIESLGPGGEGAFQLPGIISALTVTGGTGYTAGSTYFVVQGSNITGQIKITTVDGVGGITGFTLIPDSFTTTYIDNTFNGVDVSTAGWGYTLGAATLEYAVNSDVILTISGPNGTNTYSVLSNGTQPITPSGPGSGAKLYVNRISYNGALVQAFPVPPTPGTEGAVFSLIPHPPDGSPVLEFGTGYAVGQVYYLDEFYKSGSSEIPIGDGSAQVLITSIGPLGEADGVEIIGSGLQSADYQLSDWHGLSIYCRLTRLVPIETLSGGVLDILDAMAAAINGTTSNIPDPNVSAAVVTGPDALMLTALIPGVVGNSIYVLDTSQITGPDLYYYYFPVRTPTYLTGGTDGTGSGTVLPLVLPAKASIASVGGTLYIGNIGPAIIKYSGPGAFLTSTTLQGVRVLRKFAGSLIGLGLIPAPGVVVDSTDMIFAWSAAGALDIWNPLDLSGDVTGAGFEELADIGDYLTGLVVTSGTAFIIRSQGISYATPTGNAVLPFNIAHIGLGDEGEGAQITDLVCQYDQTGAFVGNSDVYSVSSSIASIGAKIKTALFNAILNNTYPLNASATCSIIIVDEVPLIVFVVETTLYIYNALNGTWQSLSLDMLPQNIAYLAASVLASVNTSSLINRYNQSLLSLVLELAGVYNFYALTPGVPNLVSISNPSTVTFPVEEVAFGRDVTVDALYLSLWGDVSENVVINFYVNFLQKNNQAQPAVYEASKVLYASLTLTPAQFSTLDGTPVEVQLFAESGTVVGHAPQLSFEVVSLPDDGEAQVIFSKIQMYCSYDSSQRPV